MTTLPVPELRQWVCMVCHSPRYVRGQFANGTRQLDIADLKLREGEELTSMAAESEIEAVESIRKKLRQHRKNILYGVGHQSPDYQWWHGQPALDGDLIRLRGILDDARRRAGLEEPPLKYNPGAVK